MLLPGLVLVRTVKTTFYSKGIDTANDNNWSHSLFVETSRYFV